MVGLCRGVCCRGHCASPSAAGRRLWDPGDLWHNVVPTVGALSLGKLAGNCLWLQDLLIKRDGEGSWVMSPPSLLPVSLPASLQAAAGGAEGLRVGGAEPAAAISLRVLSSLARCSCSEQLTLEGLQPQCFLLAGWEGWGPQGLHSGGPNSLFLSNQLAEL